MDSRTRAIPSLARKLSSQRTTLITVEKAPSPRALCEAVSSLAGNRESLGDRVVTEPLIRDDLLVIEDRTATGLFGSGG